MTYRQTYDQSSSLPRYHLSSRHKVGTCGLGKLLTHDVEKIVPAIVVVDHVEISEMNIFERFFVLNQDLTQAFRVGCNTPEV